VRCQDDENRHYIPQQHRHRQQYAFHRVPTCRHRYCNRHPDHYGPCCLRWLSICRTRPPRGSTNNSIYFVVYPDFPITTFACCAYCYGQKVVACIASYYDLFTDTCELLIRQTSGLPGPSEQCQLGVYNFDFGAPNATFGHIYPGPCRKGWARLGQSNVFGSSNVSNYKSEIWSSIACLWL
jgi:hypothetical protein